MIIQSSQKQDLLLPDMTFLTMTINQPVTEIYKNYKMLCPPILYAEIYNDTQGANKRLKNPFEVLYIEPWQILVKNELEGQPVIQSGNIALMKLKSESDMSKAEKDVVDNAKKMVEAFDKDDRFLTDQSPATRGVRNNALIGFANAPYQDLTWKQFIERFKEVSKGTTLEIIAPIAEGPATNKNTARKAIEKALSEYAEIYPIDNFKKAFAFSKNMLKNDFIGICNDVFTPILEAHFGLNRTHWDNTRYSLADSHIRENFPYTWYALYHYLAFHVYQNENTHSKKIGSRDFEYLYYLHFTNVLFVSADAQHEKYITGAGAVKSRNIGSFAYIPHIDQDPKEHNRVMRYIKNRGLY